MFWPVVLPFKITCWLLLSFLFAMFVYATRSKRTTSKVVYTAIGLTLVGFIPSCIGVGLVLDNFRFGHFHHASFEDVNDFRIERYLPPDSTNIELYKGFGGDRYFAKYEITHADLTGYVDECWERWAEYSGMPRPDLEYPPTKYFELDLPEFSNLEWSLNGEIEIYHSPVEADGGGATYYHELNTGVTLQRAYYW